MWSTDAGVTHSPPSDLVLKAQKFFAAANKVTVTLSDGDGEEQANAECIREYTFVSKSRSTGPRRGTREEVRNFHFSRFVHTAFHSLADYYFVTYRTTVRRNFKVT